MSIKLKSLRNQTLVMALCYVAMGIFFVLAPGASMTTLGTILAVAAAVIGIIKIVSFLSKKGEKNKSLTGGFLLIILALFMFIKPSVLSNALYVIIAFVILMNGTMKLETALKLRGEGNKKWGAVTVAALVTILLGVIALFAPFGAETLVVMAGISMITTGVFDAITALFMMKKIKQASDN